MTKVELEVRRDLSCGLVRGASINFVRRCFLWIFLAAVTALAGCNYHEVKGGAPDGDSPWDGKPVRDWPLNYQTLQSRILARYCTRCHHVGGKGQAVLFEPYATLIADNHLRWEAPAATSKIIRALTRNDRHRMPPPGDGEALTQDEVDFIGRWIDAGKPEN